MPRTARAGDREAPFGAQLVHDLLGGEIPREQARGIAGITRTTANTSRLTASSVGCR